MKLKIVKLEIRDNDISETLHTCYLINPDASKLAELKHMIEHRWIYGFTTDMTDEEIAKAEEFVDNIWDNVGKFIDENFVVINVEETYEIAY